MARRLFGVFYVDNVWKVFRERERAGLFDTREEALSAARSEARAAVAAGFDVELYLEEADGELKRADFGPIGH